MSGQTFKLRTPAHIGSCHLTGSWDNYGKRYAMAQDPASGPGWWKLTIKFAPTGSTKRYWYYYILDGYFESHDPNKPNCKEPTRGITLNILDYSGSSRDISPSSSTSSSSSRFPSPSSSGQTSPASSTSDKRSVIRSLTSSSKSSSTSRPVISNPIFQNGTTILPESATSRSSSHHHHSSRRQTEAEYYASKPHPSLPQANRPPSHLVHPIPRNPLNNHKLTLDTSSAYRPYSTITTAATTAGDSPVSASSSRSNSSMGSVCSSCSGSSISDGSPTTPICTCTYTARHRGGACEEFSGCESEPDSSCSEDSEVEYIRTSTRGSRKSYHDKAHGGALAYEMERRLRM